MITPFGLFSAYIIACLRFRRKGVIWAFVHNLHISNSLRDFPESHFRNVACRNTKSIDSGGGIKVNDFRKVFTLKYRFGIHTATAHQHIRYAVDCKLSVNDFDIIFIKFL